MKVTNKQRKRYEILEFIEDVIFIDINSKDELREEFPEVFKNLLSELTRVDTIEVDLSKVKNEKFIEYIKLIIESYQKLNGFRVVFTENTRTTLEL